MTIALIIIGLVIVAIVYLFIEEVDNIRWSRELRERKGKESQ